MPIKVKCGKCGAVLTGRDELAGKRVKCPRCQAVLALPAAAAVQAAEPQPQAGPAAARPASPPPPEPQPAVEPVAPEPGRDVPEVETSGPELPTGGEQPPADQAVGTGVNIPAIISLPLAFLAWLVAAIFILVVFKQLIPGLIAGAATALLALAVGVVGLILAMRKTRKVGGLVPAIFGISIAGASLISMVITLVLASVLGRVAEQLPDSVAVKHVIQQTIGTEKPTKVWMQCKACKHEFEIASTDFMRHQAALGGQAVLQGAGDINALLDKVEADGGVGYPCPECGKPAAQPMMECLHCGKRFVPDPMGMLSGAAQKCPHCGEDLPSMAEGLFGRQQPEGKSE